MKIRSYKTLNLPSEEGYGQLLELQDQLNVELRKSFESLKDKNKDVLSRELISKVETLIDEVNLKHYNLHRGDYSGDKNYQHSEQTFCNKSIVIQFIGFSAQISMDSWRDNT